MNDATTMPAAGGADFRRRFMPEPLTPLYYTPSYAALSAAQRLRYNQLHACYLNEQIQFFERSLAHTFLSPLLAERLPERLDQRLRRFIADEDRHIEMFRRLNLRCEPQRYAGGDFHFVRVPYLLAPLLRLATRRPRQFPLFAWLMLIQEERSVYYAGEFIREAEVLEPHFVRVHRAHLADEVHHVDWDEELIEYLWRRSSPAVRALNARLFGWMLAEFFATPKRAGLRVLAALAVQFPELGARLPEMGQQLQALSGNRDWLLSLYSRPMLPRTFAHFDRWPEFRSLARALPGYAQQELAA